MKRLICLTVPFLSLAITGCGDESDRLPVDGREFDGVEYAEPAPYQGRVIDGYLKNARVWLDMDGDGQYTPGPMNVELTNGTVVTLAAGEPTAMSGEGGRFSIDISSLRVDPAVGPSLDPRNYPLYALAIPGKTLEETYRGDVVVEQAYLMSASPGIRNVTPLTTLARFRADAARRNSLSPVSDSELANLDGLNLWQDYIIAGDERAHAYARALARFMASQIPDSYNQVLSQPGSDGTERHMSTDAVFLLGYSLVQNASDVIAVVDAAAAGNFSNIDVDVLDLPEVPVELANPVLLTGQQVLAHSRRGQGLPTSTSDLELSAELFFDYTEDGQLLSVSSRGCIAPSLPELARLIQVDGYMAQLKTQWLPTAALSLESRNRYEEEGDAIHERIVFDWNNNRAFFDTVTQCHVDTWEVLPESSELDGTAEVSWSWTESNTGVELIERFGVSGSERRRLITLQGNSPTALLGAGRPDWVTGYRVARNAIFEAELSFVQPDESCIPENTDRNPRDDAAQYVTHLFPFVYSGDTEAASSFGPRAYEYDARLVDGLNIERLLKLPLLNSAWAALAEVNSDDGAFQWQLYYPRLDAVSLGQNRPNLIQSAYLMDASTVATCGTSFLDVPRNAFARVDYEYQTLSDYLVGLLAE
ncbi:hypothetical protein [Marinobacter halophilus]|uniref:Lipoprotein n=1 Tax=Marinobacter halophilus TaxID=1323740 RepID=A0A2T1KBM5_9GAMM|nr:hypothetical protein [Marinobacter halophilus]PSF07539.1 hypothetical protein C7H08_12840 [Marinobacter halophilus]